MMKRYRFFGGLLAAQENWLNAMADKGFRLVRTGKLDYEFQPCAPGEVEYRVEFIGGKSRAHAQDYRRFLEEMGYRVWEKPINLSYSVGKVRWRPWAEPGGRLATQSTTYNRELLVVEKRRDGKPFSLHTTNADRQQYCKSQLAPCLFCLLAGAALAVIQRTWIWGLFALAAAVPALCHLRELLRLKKQARTWE